MKKLSIFCMMIASVLSMTSCLESKGNKIDNYSIGVVDVSTKVMKRVVYLNDAEYLYIPQVDTDVSVKNGDCCIVAYSIDYDDPINANWSTKGYITASMREYVKLEKTESEPMVADITQKLEKEIPITNLDDPRNWGLIKNNLFVTVRFKEVLTDMKKTFRLGYDFSVEPEEVNGDTVYNLYLRAIQTDEGKSPTINVEEIDVFHMDGFLQHATMLEKQAGKKVVKFRINYVQGIGEDNKLDWEKTDVLTYNIAE